MPAPHRIRTPKFRILSVMVVSMAITYLPWYNFSAVLTYIAREYALSPSDTGVIIACFQAGYVITVVMTGWLADRIGAKAVVLYATLFTAVFSTLFVFVVEGRWSIMVMRLLTGCACGAVYAPGMTLLSDWFPPRERGAALGAYTAAITVASAGGYFVAGPLAAWSGWRAGMFLTSVPVFLAFALILFFVRENPDRLQEEQEAAPEAPERGYAGPALITVSYMGHMWELHAFWAWTGPFLVACALASGMQPDEAVRAGSLLAACVTMAGAPAVWLMGKVSDRIGRTRCICLCAVASLAPEFFFGSLLGYPLFLVVAAGVWMGFWVIADSSIYKAGLTEMCPRRVRTTLLGFQSALGFSMTIAAPLLFGTLLQAFNPGTSPTQATHWGPAYASLGLGALVAPLAALLLRRHPQAGLMSGGRR